MASNKIQLCAIGNGLVDMQYQITEEIIDKLNLPKGEMRLVEADEQSAIINLLDSIRPNKCSGGSATNTIEAFAKFGGKSAYLTVCGDDENGNFYYKELENSKIQFKRNVISNVATGTCLVLITPDGERTMLTSLAASKEFDIEHLDENLIADAEWLYLEGYKFSENKGTDCVQKAIDIAKSHNTKIAITASDVYIIDTFNNTFIAALKRADLLFCNETEANAIAKCENCDEAINKLAKEFPKTNIVMTKGKDGAKLLFDGKFYEIGPYPAIVLDTTGAGDMFAGAFLYGMLNFENNNIQLAGILASRASSLVVEQTGARYSGNFNDIIKAVVK